MRADVILGDCLDVLRTMPAMSVDAVVTDPPYGLKFMGKLWDHGVPGEQFWAEALRVAKPGAALLAFGGTRTFHRLACAIEDSGWRIYDCLSWMYGQGFPKHRTHLKPAWEPIVFAAKKGARFVNVEGCRIGDTKRVPGSLSAAESRASSWSKPPGRAGDSGHDPHLGRWPANVVLSCACGGVSECEISLGDSGDGSRTPTATAASTAGRTSSHKHDCPVRLLDEQSGETASGSRKAGDFGGLGYHGMGVVPMPAVTGDSGGASRFFYTAKASRADREDGLEGMPLGPAQATARSKPAEGRQNALGMPRGNHHPTVKPTDLMRWLCRLVTPPGGTVLDPFCGSGSTGVAANAEGFDFIGIEREAEYVEIARRRIANVAPLFAEGGAA